MKRIYMIILAGFLTTATLAYAHEGHEQGVSFVTPEDGATISRIFKVKMAVKGMEVHKAGDVVNGTGHLCPFVTVA